MYTIKKGNEGDYVFVLGNTKFLRDCNEAEMAVLYENKDARIQREKEEKRSKKS